MGQDDYVTGRRLRQVRCERCNARLFDTNAGRAGGQNARVEIWIKCWRCDHVVVVYLGQAAGTA
jgi:phage FluMu protein Com